MSDTTRAKIIAQIYETYLGDRKADLKKARAIVKSRGMNGKSR